MSDNKVKSFSVAEIANIFSRIPGVEVIMSPNVDSVGDLRTVQTIDVRCTRCILSKQVYDRKTNSSVG
jgi:hypothetical protein